MEATRNSRFSLEVPMDIVSDILSRLSVEPLVRFTSVSKTWYALIQSPNFTNYRLTKSDKNKVSLFSIGSNHETRKYSMRLHSSEKTRDLAGNPNFLFESSPLVVGICNGLVCAMLDNSQAIICNPTIGRFRKIPRIFKLPKRKKSDFVFWGFVFQDNDYKLFRIIYSRVDCIYKTFIRGEVYNMSSDAWSNIDVKNGDVDILNTRDFFCNYQLMPVVINEVFYRVVSVKYETYVAYFDAKLYVFGSIRLPMNISGKLAYLVDLKGQLGSIIIFDARWFELWVFEEKERSWTMMHRLDDIPSMSINWLLRCLRCDRNKLVMKSYSIGELKFFWYDLATREITYLSFPGMSNGVISYLYTESFIWHDVEKKEDKRNSQGRFHLLRGLVLSYYDNFVNFVSKICA